SEWRVNCPQRTGDFRIRPPTGTGRASSDVPALTAGERRKGSRFDALRSRLLAVRAEARYFRLAMYYDVSEQRRPIWGMVRKAQEQKGRRQPSGSFQKCLLPW